MINSSEYYELLEMFEKTFNLKVSAREKDKELWKKGYTYASGEINKIFKAYEMGYSYGKFKEANK